MNRDLLRRVARLERDRHPDEPTSILTDRPLEADEGDALLANWRELVDAGEATLSGCALVLISGQVMTDEGWEAVHCRPEVMP